jgi:CubicO group peptidase (beta-lactamase class C family)
VVIERTSQNMKQQIIILILFTFLFTSCKEKTTPLDELGHEKEIYSAIITKDNKPVFREFYNGKTEKDLFNIQSETKSIIAILTGIAIDKGFIKSVDQPISDFFPQILNDKNDKKKEITIRHLLNQTSGLKDFEYPRIEKWLADPNPSNLILSQPLVSEPGSTYQYNTAGTHLLSVILSKVTQMETAIFADENLFKPLNIENYKWEKLNDGYHDGGGLSLWMKADDLVKIGQLLLSEGQYHNTQIVSKQWVSELFRKENKLKAHWGIRNSLHGFCWYSAKYKGLNLNYAMGYGGQFIIIIPNLNSVIAVNYNHDTETGIENANKFIEKYLPLFFDEINEQSK